MPLPIETPAPKASSLIKRFQQTIDSQDGNQSLPLPDSSNKLSSVQISQGRRSASAGAPQLVRSPQLNSLVRSSWNSPGDSPKLSTPSRPQTADNIGQLDSRILSVLSDHPTTTPHDSPHSFTAADFKENQMPQTFRNSVQSDLELPLAPPIDQPSDLSRLSDLCKSDLAVQSPVSSSKTTPRPPSSPPRKLKALVSAEISQAPQSRKISNQITAPTAASLAKMRDSQVSRPSSQTIVPTIKPGSGKALLRSNATGSLPKDTGNQVIAKVGASPKLTAAKELASGTATIRQAKTSSCAPKERAKMQQVRPSTPATSHALRKSVTAKAKVPPLPTSINKVTSARTSPLPVKATTRRVVTTDSQKPNQPDPRSQTANHTTVVKNANQRPLQRARVASAATPISGVRKSPSLKPTALAASKTPDIAKPASAGAKRFPNSKTPSSKDHPVVTQASRSTKTPKQTAISFPSASSTKKNGELVSKNQEGPLSASTGKELDSKDTNQGHIKAKPVVEPELEQRSQQEKESLLGNPNEFAEDQDLAVTPREDEDNRNHQVEKQEKILPRPDASDEDGKSEQISSNDAHCFHPGVDETNDQKRVVGLIDSIVFQPTQVQSEELITMPIDNTDAQLFQKHPNALFLSEMSLNSDEDQSKADFDASTTTNTDVEE